MFVFVFGYFRLDLCRFYLFGVTINSLTYISVAKVTTELFSEESSRGVARGSNEQTLDYKNLKGEDISNSSGVESATLESSNQSSELSALDSITSSQLPDITALENIQLELEKLHDTVNSTEVEGVETIVVTTSQGAETSTGSTHLEGVLPGTSLLTSTVHHNGTKVAPAKTLISTDKSSTETTTTVLPGQTLLRRPGVPGQVVTKVIITKNPGSGKVQAMPTVSGGGSAAGTNTATSEIVLSAPVTSQLLAAHAQSTAAGSGSVNNPTNIVVTQASLLSPTKLGSSIQTSSTTPTKLIFTSKGLTTGRSPTKIAIPLNTQSPQKILQSGQFKIVSASSLGGATTTAASGGIQPKKLTFSPQKVIIRPQQPGTTGVSLTQWIN